MTLRFSLTIALALIPNVAFAQVAIPYSRVDSPARMDATLRRAVQAEAGTYSLVGFRFFARDSALLVFEDSTLTGAALRSNSWMFGPPVTAAEADGCPPEKVLGRKIARALWQSLGKPPETSYIIVAVRGTNGIERWTATGMYYHHTQLEGAWVGDPKRPDG